MNMEVWHVLFTHTHTISFSYEGSRLYEHCPPMSVTYSADFRVLSLDRNSYSKRDYTEMQLPFMPVHMPLLPPAPVAAASALPYVPQQPGSAFAPPRPQPFAAQRQMPQMPQMPQMSQMSQMMMMMQQAAAAPMTNMLAMMQAAAAAAAAAPQQLYSQSPMAAAAAAQSAVVRPVPLLPTPEPPRVAGIAGLLAPQWNVLRLLNVACLFGNARVVRERESEEEERI